MERLELLETSAMQSSKNQGNKNEGRAQQEHAMETHCTHKQEAEAVVDEKLLVAVIQADDAAHETLSSSCSSCSRRPRFWSRSWMSCSARAR